MVDNGELLINFHFNPDTEPPIDAAAETITITFPSTATWAFSGFMTNYAPEGTFESKMVASATVVVRVIYARPDTGTNSNRQRCGMREGRAA
ncbi:MAG: hypothetical protein ACYTEX_27670 [Planctomycetota bacterium]